MRRSHDFDLTELDTLMSLQDAYESAMSDLSSVKCELDYMWAFLAWKHLENQFLYFRWNAHEVWGENDPFPRLVL